MAILLGRAALLSAKLPYRDVPVPEMGPDAVVRIQQMSVNTRAAFLERIRQYNAEVYAYEDDQKQPEDQRKNLAKPEELDIGALGIVSSIADEDGNLLFTEADIPLLGTWANNAVRRIWDEVQELNAYRMNQIAAVETEKKD